MVIYNRLIVININLYAVYGTNRYEFRKLVLKNKGDSPLHN